MTERDVVAHLRTKGFRITRGRIALLRFALASKGPFSAPEIHKRFTKKGLQSNLVTIYRELQFLSDQGIVNELVFIDGVKRYELRAATHRHHLICTSCSAVQHVEMNHDLDAVEKKIAREKSFRVQRHALEFYGLCAKCA
jgi:Fe2+ or Zn2+ uptake regulation protein